jgi:site-specific DNA recombinase
VVRAAIYVRVSTDDRGQDTTRQLTDCRFVCQRREWEVAYEIEDKASGQRTDRPGFQQLMQLVSEKKIDAVVVWALDRLSRSLKDTLDFGELLRKHDVDLVSSTHGEIDTSGPMGEFQFSLLGALARLESRIIGERVRSGMAERKRQGQKFGGDNKSASALAVRLHGRKREIGEEAALAELAVKVGQRRAQAAKRVLDQVDAGFKA